MYIAIYVSVIVLFCAIGLTIYGVHDKKNKERQRVLQEKAKTETPAVLQENLFTKVELDPMEKEEEPLQSQQEEQMEDFSFTGEEEAESDDLDIDTDEIDRRFKEYEEFLRKNVYNNHEVDSNHDAEDKKVDAVPFEDDYAGELFINTKNSDHDDLSELSDFDYNSLVGKSEQEIEDILQKLPLKVQQIMLSDILARRKFDDEQN